MKTKSFIQMMLTAAMVVVIGFGMGSCVDNVDNGTTPSEKEQQEQEAKQAKTQKFWSVVSQLVDVDDYTEDYEDKTFEPTYGVAQGTDGTRYVYTNTATAAAERFADLVERDDIDENTQTYTYDDPDVGKFVYTKGTGKNLATVEVRVKQIPNLKKIVYVPGAYANGSFQGRAYYRFGDVVARKVGNDTEYWICVRPSFGKEGKGDSHWVCLNSLPEKNVKHYHSNTNSKDYYMPENIGNDKENMQNLAEMLYAIYFSEQWEGNVSDIANTNLEMFHDFDKTRYKLHNKYFWQNVRNKWKEARVLESALNYTLGENEFMDMLQNQGLHLLYYGYSWWFSTSWFCTLYDACYKNGAAINEKNMHQVSYKGIEKHMRELNLDCRVMGQTNLDKYNSFFGDNIPRWVIRHATGKELSNDGQYNVKGAIHGVTTLYRYYQDVNPTDDYTLEPEETLAPTGINKDNVKVGDILAQNGCFYRNVGEAWAAGTEPKAVVVYLGGNKRVEKDSIWNGLAIALDDVKKNDGNEGIAFSGEEIAKNLCTSNAAVRQHIAGRCDGWSMTQHLKDKCNLNHSHPAAEAVGALQPIEGCSGWFIPSAGQWNLAMIGLGFGTLSKDPDSGLWKYLEQGHVADIYNLVSGKSYMTCTESYRASFNFNVDETDGWIYSFDYNTTLRYMQFVDVNKTRTDLRVRPFIAFKYGNGGVEKPEETWKPLAAPQVKSWLGEDGQFYKDGADVYTSTGHTPVGYVAYYGNPGSIKVDTINYRGIIINTYPYPQEFMGITQYQQNGILEDQFKTRLPDDVRQQKGFSPWFIGTKEQWKMIFEQGFDLTFVDDAVQGEALGSKQNEIQEFYISNYVGSAALSGPYWTSTSDDEGGCYLEIIPFRPIKFNTTDETDTKVGNYEMRMLPMMAF
jgi:hypothetical protein